MEFLLEYPLYSGLAVSCGRSVSFRSLSGEFKNIIGFESSVVKLDLKSNIFAIATRDGRVEALEIGDRIEFIRRIDAEEVAVSKDGKYLLTASPLELREYPFERSTRIGGEFNLLAAYELAAAARGNRIHVRDPEEGKVIEVIKADDPVKALAISKNLVAFVSRGGLLNRVVVKEIGGEKIFNSLYSASSVAISPNERYFAIGSSGEAMIYDVSGEMKVKLSGEHSGAINAIAFSPDEKLIALAGEDFKASVRTIDGELISVIRPRRAPVTGVAFVSSPFKNVLRIKLENKPRRSSRLIAYKNAAELGLKFLYSPVKALEEAAELGVLDILVDILLEEGLLEESSGAYRVKVPAEIEEGEVIVDEERIDLEAERVARRYSKILRKKEDVEAFLKKLKEKFDRFL